MIVPGTAADNDPVADEDGDGIPDDWEPSICFFLYQGEDVYGTCTEDGDYTPPGCFPCPGTYEYKFEQNVCDPGCTDVQTFNQLILEPGDLTVPATWLVRCTFNQFNIPFVTVSDEQACPPGSTYDSTVMPLTPATTPPEPKFADEIFTVQQGECSLTVKVLVLGFGHNEHTYAGIPCARIA